MIVVARRSGCRLGNRLEQAAHLFALCHLTGNELALPVFAQYGKCFVGSEGDPFCRFPQRPRNLVMSLIPHSLAYAFSWLLAVSRPNLNWLGISYYGCDNDREVDLMSTEFLHELAKSRIVLLHQGWKYRCREGLEAGLPAMRKFFAPTRVLAETTKQRIIFARKHADVLIGVHVRQTDFKFHLGGRFYFSVEEYSKVMKALEEQFRPRRVAFLVTSDENLQEDNFRGLDVSFGSGEVIEDLYALAGCDYIVGPEISSFSGWASLYGEVPFLGLHSNDQKVFLADFKPSPLLS